MSRDRNDSTPPSSSRPENTPPGWREEFLRGWESKAAPDDHPLYQDGAQLFIVRRPRLTEKDPKGERA